MNEINVEFDLNDLEKLQDCSCFIHNWQYSKHEHPTKTEFGKIAFIDLVIRFHAQPERSKREDFKSECDKYGHPLELKGECAICPHLEDAVL